MAQWVVSAGLFVPQLRDDAWDLAAACVELEEATAVPARRWSELASRFLEDLDASGVWRTAPVDPLGGL